MSEETLMGLISKTSGIATAASRFRQAVNGQPKVVCGAWKKMPPLLKHSIRSAVVHGGAAFRISDEPFIYLDKNYVRILGGIQKCLEAMKDLKDHIKVVQLKGTEKDIVSEALEAVEYGAHIIFIDSGRIEDVKRVSDKLNDLDQRQRVKIAFGSGVVFDDMAELKKLDIDILDIGRPIVDAPLLDMRMDVLAKVVRWKAED
jgi:nicotinate-nucleotide pyrophosphorylase (carboxylating)